MAMEGFTNRNIAVYRISSFFRSWRERIRRINAAHDSKGVANYARIHDAPKPTNEII